MPVPNYDDNFNTGFWAQTAGNASGLGTDPNVYLKYTDIFYNGQHIGQYKNTTNNADSQAAFDKWLAGGPDSTTRQGTSATWFSTYQSELATQRTQSDAFTFLDDTFRKYGLDTLSAKIKEYIIGGYTGDTIALKLAETPEYKTRFAGNEVRRQKGLSVLSPAQYIGMEDQYKDLFRQYGLPANMYDTKEDFATYIGNDVSAQEMDGRMSLVRKSVRSDNPSTRAAYQQWYAAGLTEGDAIAAILDPTRALPELERRQRSAAIKGAADWHGLGTGVDGVTIGTAELLGDKGVTEDDANRGFAAIKQFAEPTKALGRRYGQDYSLVDAESEVFFNAADAREKRERLYGRETAEFAGSSNASTKSFGQKRY